MSPQHSKVLDMNCVIQLSVDIRYLKSFVVGKASLGLTIACACGREVFGRVDALIWSC